jgi:hypothetical protein
MARLLRKGNEADWANACERLAAKYGEDPRSTRREILAMYGGMGSFNDVVLYGRNGQVLIDESDELARLRLALHAECREEL